MRPFRLAAALLAFALLGAAPDPFAYDAAASLQLRAGAATAIAQGSEREVTFATGRGSRTAGMLVRPEAERLAERGVTPAMTFWEWFLFGSPPPADVAAYVRTMSAYDLPVRLPSTHARAVLFQFARRDPYVAQTTAAAAKALLADRDRTVKSYDTGHPLDEAARTDRTAWLAAHLELPER